MVKTENTYKNISCNNDSSISKSLRKKKYKGVRMRSWGSWVSEIRAPNQKTRIWLGSYSTAEAAARAYDAALICLRGTSATTNLNFSDSLRGGFNHEDNLGILSPKSIQRIAALAAANSSGRRDNPAGEKPRFLKPNSPPLSSSSSSSSNDSSFSSSIPSSSSSSPLISDSIAADDCWVQFDDAVEASWYNFDSPKYNEMVNGVFFDIPTMVAEDAYCDGDGEIKLWSFC